MGGKHSLVRKKLARAYAKGKHLNPDMLVSCEGKVRYTSMDKAKEACYSTMNAYKCRHCKFYHKGRKP